MRKIIIFSISIFLILFYWKETIFRITANLYNWNDVPFVIWVIQNNIRHFANLDLNLLYETNAMYPFPLSLSFTEHMFFPAYLNFIISWFVKGQIAQFNILLIVNHILIYAASFLLAGRFSNSAWIRAIFGFFMAFSPYVFSQIGHFQMLFFWPLILSFYLFFSAKKEIIQQVLIGFLLGLQFLSSVYLGIMGLCMYVLYFVVQGLVRHRRRELGAMLREASVLIITFLVISSPSIYGYVSVQQLYHPSYEQGQYVSYSAHITDYFLVLPNDSILNRHVIRPIIGAFNNHNTGETAGFVGFMPLIIVGMLLIGRLRNTHGINFRLRKSGLGYWLMLLIILSFVFSLGPRMNWNGRYLVIPLPYMFILKHVPFAGIMRALARWYFVIIFSTGILTILGLEGLRKNLKNVFLKKWLLPVFFILYLLEFYPTAAKANRGSWWQPSYQKVRQICERNPGAMMEYPFEYRAQNKNALRNLSYKTGILLASMEHDCEILSGFSAYEPKKFLEYQRYFQERNFDRSSMKLLNDLKFKYIKFNLDSMNRNEKKYISWFVTTEYVDTLYEDNSTIIVQVKKVKPLPKPIK